MRVTAYCPGHITGFFLPCMHKDPLRTGSRGAGLCIDKGVTTTLTVEEGAGSMELLVDGERRDAPVVRSALVDMMGNTGLDVVAESTMDLPASSGFGISAAAALSAAFAAAKVLGRSRDEAFAAAHRAELINGTGLGDVAALTQGGMTFRRIEGLPPYGRIDRLADSLSIVTGVVGPVIQTADVLEDEHRRRSIERVGRECYRALVRDPTPRTFFRVSKAFTLRTGLAGHKVMEALEVLEEVGDASMIMLGNSVFARGDLDAIERRLSRFGPTFRLSLDIEGPRVLEVEGSLV